MLVGVTKYALVFPSLVEDDIVNFGLFKGYFFITVMSFSVILSATFTLLTNSFVVCVKKDAEDLEQPVFICSIFIFLGSFIPSVQNKRPSKTLTEVMLLFLLNFKKPKSEKTISWSSIKDS